jgi:YfiH family protein
VPFYNADQIKYYRFSTLENKELYHAIFTRRGGFSPNPWHSLNFGASVGDEVERVIKNRKTALESLEIVQESVYDLYQVHSSKVVIAYRPLSLDEIHQKADAIITNQPNVTLMMRFADCVPILLYDPIHHAVGIVHAGWKGTVEKIVKNAVSMMAEAFDTTPRELIAAIGPSIGPDHYAIGSDVLEKIKISFSDCADQFILHRKNKYFFDLWQANSFILSEMGVDEIEISGICTCCNLDDWYSHRGENGKTGRFGAVIGLHS